jgi:hypothetical protein
MTENLNPHPEHQPSESLPSDAVLEAWEQAVVDRNVFQGQYGPTRIDFDLGRAHERLLRYEAYERTRDSDSERSTCERA